MGEKVPPESEAGGNPGLSSRPNHATREAQTIVHRASGAQVKVIWLFFEVDAYDVRN